MTEAATIPRTRVAIIGGGPGGLALAQGLAKLGIAFELFERDRARTDYVQGFRLGIRERGLNALRTVLPENLYEAVVETSGASPVEGSLVNESLETIDAGGGWGRGGEQEDLKAGKSVSRITLRQVLLSGIDEHVHLGAVFSRYEQNGDGTVRAFFEGGSAIDAELLVGADGAGSRVGNSFFPDAAIFDTGVRRLAGKMTLDAAAHHGILPLLTEKNVGVVPVKTAGTSRSLFITAHRVNPAAYKRFGLIGSDDASHKGLDGFHFNNTTSYVWWNTAYWNGELAPDAVLDAADGRQLLGILLAKLEGWHPAILDLIRFTDPSTVANLKVRSSRPVEHWPTGNVTLLGDAIHSMTYFRALGGNTALHDAGLLTQELSAVEAGRKEFGSAVHDYEAAMLAHGFEAVRTSLANMERAIGAPANAAAA